MIPLGIRTHNMTNVDPCGWIGEQGTRPEDGCAYFDTDEHGLMAGAHNLHSYGLDGIKTISAMAARWAPAGAKNGPHNDPVSYAKAVSEVSGLDPESTVDFTNRATNFLVVKGIIFAENSNQPSGAPWYTNDQIIQAQAATGLWG